jgi:hypothetical protein
MLLLPAPRVGIVFITSPTNTRRGNSCSAPVVGDFSTFLDLEKDVRGWIRWRRKEDEKRKWLPKGFLNRFPNREKLKN